ncbi:MAG: stage 0 sporulation protein [Candidatus Aureabacteria bacterium]|nr:stage 0 sporulation protein [Candidatus Auribacterota bacterium]
MKKALVRNRRQGRIDVYLTDIEDLECHDMCILTTDRGFDYGTFVRYCGESESDEKQDNLPKIERRANQQDRRKIEQNMIEEKKGIEICQKKIKDLKKDMKLVSVEYTFDKTKMIFYFTAKGRIDFRDLVKELASTFKTRIELRQIGVRDESKIIGGLGPCGRMLCCCSWIREFDAVNIKMAKTQRLSLNPEKISGLCGRLLCCLRYEYFTYKFYEGKIPLEGSFVKYKGEIGQVESVNILKGTLSVRFNDDRKIEINGEEAKVVEKKTKNKED